MSEGGGVTVLDSSRANRDVAGDAGKGYASPVSRRRLPGRAVVGDDRPYGVPEPCEIEVLRKDRPSLGVPSLLVFWVGGLSGELTEDKKIYTNGKHGGTKWDERTVCNTSLSSSVSSVRCRGCMLPSLSQHWSTPL